MSRFHPDDERHADLIAAINAAAHLIATSIKQGFEHMASVEDAALADLAAAVTSLASAVATEIQALQAAINAQGVNNSPAIETAVQNINTLVSDLKTSVAPIATPPATPATPAAAPAAAKA